MEVRVYGFPDYQKNNEIRESDGIIKRKRSSPVDNELRYETTAPILSGNSGGPVVNELNEVIGVAVRGTQEYPNDIIPIYDILEYLMNDEKT